MKSEGGGGGARQRVEDRVSECVCHVCMRSGGWSVCARYIYMYNNVAMQHVRACVFS